MITLAFWTIVLRLMLVVLVNGASVDGGRPKIAIIGGGIGGTSCSYFLREMMGPEVEIDLFERSAILGGRLATVDIGGHRYEAGGSIIHQRNRYMKQFVKMFELKERDSSGTSNEIMAIYDGQQYVFQESSWPLITMFQMIWRYRLDVIWLRRSIENMLDQFDRIYQLQKDGYAFSTVEKLLRAMSQEFPMNARRTLQSYLESKGFSERLVDELAGAAMRVNYGQNVSITGFVGTVGLAGIGESLWSVDSGNRLVPEALFNHSNSTLHECNVQQISKTIVTDNRSVFTIACSIGNDDLHHFGWYDLVVLALPLIQDITNLRFDGIQIPSINYGQYHRLWATFVYGTFNETAFGSCRPESDWSIFGGQCPNGILVCCDDHIWFNSVGTLRPIDYKKGQSTRNQGKYRAWKVFSNEKLTDNQLKILFDDIVEWKIIEWLAYPSYISGPDEIYQKIENGKFEPADGVFHVNTIEWAASAMEMSVIGAKNVALLVKDYLVKKGLSKKMGNTNVDEQDKQSDRTEL